MPIPAPELDDLQAISKRWGLDIGNGDLGVARVGGQRGHHRSR